MEEKETAKQTLERMGAARVRILLFSGNLLQHLMAEAVDWLAHLDEDERSRNEASLARNEASQAEQARTARIAKNAAVTAAISAIIVIIISTLTWLYPRH